MDYDYLVQQAEAGRTFCVIRRTGCRKVVGDILEHSKPYMTARDAGLYLGGIHSRTIRRWAREGYKRRLKLHIGPRWGALRLSEVRTIAVEEWLPKLPFAPGTRAKLRNIMSALFSHCIRCEWLTFNPISKVHTSAVRLRDPDVLTPDEFRALLPRLALREREMVMLAGSIGLRRSEMFALRWADIDLLAMQVSVTRP